MYVSRKNSASLFKQVNREQKMQKVSKSVKFCETVENSFEAARPSDPHTYFIQSIYDSFFWHSDIDIL